MPVFPAVNISWEREVMFVTKLHTVAIAIAIAAVTMIVGCGSIRVVREARGGGTVALEGSHDGAREKAERYMRTQCPDGYEVMEEGDATSADGVAREWRITYACTGTQAPRTALVAF